MNPGSRQQRITLAVVSLSLLASAPPLRAEFLASYTGNTQMSQSAGSDGIVNFALYENSSDDWTAALGLAGIATFFDAIDLDAKHIFFYQVVNTNPTGPADDHSLSTLRVTTNGVPYTSAGWLSNTVFVDDQGNVGSAANRFLGTDLPADKGDDVVDGVPTESGISLAGFAALAAAMNPSAAERDADAGPDGFASFSWNAKIAPGGFSTVVFLTNNGATQYTHGEIQNGSAPSNGDVPAHVGAAPPGGPPGGPPSGPPGGPRGGPPDAPGDVAPEPASLVVWGLSAALMGLVVARMRRRRATA
jgi:hypothetical protein